MFSQCMADRSRLASHRVALESNLAEEWADNQADVYVLERDDMVAVWIQDQKDQGRSDSDIKARFEELVGETTLTLLGETFTLIDDHGATLVVATMDAKILSSLGRDMQRSGNIFGQYSVRSHNGKQYISFKGNHRLRTVIKGTRYGLKNPTIVKMGIGPDGLKQTAKGGVYVTVVVSVGLNGIAWIFNEDFGWRDFLSNVSEDMVKAAIAAVAGFLAGAIVGSVSGFALIAGAAGFIVGIMTGVLISDISAEDVTELARKVSDAFHKSISVLSNPKAYIDHQVQRAEDAAYCTLQSAGDAVVHGTMTFLRRRVEEFLRGFSPYDIR